MIRPELVGVALAVVALVVALMLRPDPPGDDEDRDDFDRHAW